jgi:hypothetical protein
MLAGRTQIIAFFALIFGLYGLLIPVEHTADAYGYAAAMGRGELWSPHHLMYQAWILTLSKLWLWTGVEPIFLYSLLNSIAMILALLAVYSMLPSRIDKRWWLLVAAFSFATVRFGTENETYAWPLMFSLWGTLQLLKGRQVLAAFLLALAVLFHQIHLFWCLALLVYAWRNGRWQFKWFYLGLVLSAAAVVWIYSQIALIQKQALWYYLTHDAQEGLVDFQWGFKSLALSVINLVRSFVQVHASTLALFDSPWVLVFVVAALLIAAGLLLGLKLKRLSNEMWGRPFAWVLVFQLAFAIFSQGNAEFMVMIPALLVLEWAHEYRRSTHLPIVALGMGLFLWNGSTLLATNADKDALTLSHRVTLLQQIDAEIESEHFVYVARDKVLLDNYIDYKKIAFSRIDIWKAPGYGSDVESMEKDMVKSKGSTPIIIDTKQVIGRQTRADLLGADKYNQWVSDHQWDPSDHLGVKNWWVLRRP